MIRNQSDDTSGLAGIQEAHPKNARTVRRPHAINQWGGRAKRHCLAARLRRSDWVVAA
nr:MAG TPA: hypothetical protein [Caudoviricetes sp.]